MITSMFSMKVRNFEASVGGIKMREPSHADRRITFTEMALGRPVPGKVQPVVVSDWRLENTEPKFEADTRPTVEPMMGDARRKIKGNFEIAAKRNGRLEIRGAREMPPEQPSVRR